MSEKIIIQTLRASFPPRTIDEMIKQAEISRIIPAPKYAGEEFREGDGSHPSHEERIKRLLEEIKKVQGGEK